MAFLRSLAASSVVPAAVAVAALSSSSLSPPKLSLGPTNLGFGSLPLSTLPPSVNPNRTFAVTHFSPVQTGLQMDSHTTERNQSQQENSVPPELLTEFMVDMKCEGCVSAVKNKLQIVDGVKGVNVDLSNQVVRVLGSSSVKSMTDALEQTGRKARLIGQGVPEDFLVSAAVAEFKGPTIFGVVRLAQVNMELARVEANFSGLSPGKRGWSINEFGDLTRGAVSTGKIFNPINQMTYKELLGDLGTLDVEASGEAHFSGVKEKLRVSDLIGRSIVLYEAEDKSDPGIAAAVIARSAGVGENYKKICTCDGTVIWDSSASDFVKS
ncbi:copper chaperone for superoxide dismutase, chloroplastic-like [Aristolochia californica]|uniref:copper chaperone for superoxide dismutase, chloroplastic-like n=1 Tax=Aristolochia californica TaxID=171875 RepID=UPI0035DBC662